ncbi:hypothetical protein GCM10007927_34410 [Sulfitobacter pacificus]|uniref:Uncharacterized protein n=1 Tax=Sulfitobacter pacificus TaxID=1499314 RepID=A0ABQ5VNX4_9RHOB|nr:hypothetical protein GCM10007927_34410 [Sulfitobacter pacificus]
MSFQPASMALDVLRSVRNKVTQTFKSAKNSRGLTNKIVQNSVQRNDSTAREIAASVKTLADFAQIGPDICSRLLI